MEKIDNIKKQFDKLPESFEVDFLNSRRDAIISAMSKIGDFVFSRSGSDVKGQVYFEGESKDGTKIRIIIEKDDEYKSPYEIAKKEKEIEEAKNDKF